MAISIKSFHHPSLSISGPVLTISFHLSWLKIIVKLSTQTQKQFYVYYIIHKDKDLDSNIKSENESDDKSMTCILVVELWQGQIAIMVFYLIIVGLESIAMFGSFGFFAVWCFIV